MSLPNFQTQDKDLSLLQSSWGQVLNKLLELPTTKGILIKNVPLAVGANTVNHMLGRKLQGWQIVRQRAASSIFDTQDTNMSQNLTLVLNSSAAVSVDLYVF